VTTLLPGAEPPFEGAPDAATHLRNVFSRMGFDDKEIVALSAGLHSLPGGVRLAICATRTRLMGCTHSRGVSDWLHVRP
jgi:catalase (peroxidase I)